MIKYKTRGGLIKDPPKRTEFNPFEYGVTTLMFRQFNRFQEYKDEEINNLNDYSSNGIELGLQYDNTDFSMNPSMGGKHYIGYSRDGDLLNIDSKWDFIEIDTSHYFNLGESEHAKQRIIAFNLWTGYSPSWELEDLNNGTSILNDAPPFNEGSTLGGWYRMRGYESYRFHDKAVLYSSFEYRYTLKHNPTENIKFLKLFKIDWVQVVGFAEAGQVAPEYNISALTKNLKFDAGISLRALASGLVVRLDVATSEEGTNTWVMVNHPF